MIPKIDSEIGISVYTTSFKGCGGKIRVSNKDFAVFEGLSKKALSKIGQDGDYAVYKLKKHGIDTNHALQSIFRKKRLRLKSLGLKDASAITEQYVCTQNKTKTAGEISDSKYSLEKIGFVKKPLSKKDMIANHFAIKISDSNDFSGFNEYDKVLNYYGYQRFGGKRPVTHLIGKAIVQRNYNHAVDLLLSFTSEYDSKENTELRTKLSDKANYSKLLPEISPQMDLERIVVKAMIDSDDSFKAIRTLPLNMRRFFVQAYQSFLFNHTLSAAFEYGEDLFAALDGDVCYDVNGDLGKFVKGKDQFLAVPFIGYSYYKKTRFHYFISKILEKEEIQAKDFFIKEIQEASSEGGFRNSTISVTDYEVSGDTVSFSLSRGSFATIVLREIMKPEDPLLAGF